MHPTVKALPWLDSVHSLLDDSERLTPRAEAHGRYEDVYRRYPPGC
jgi:hypothetical protein